MQPHSRGIGRGGQGRDDSNRGRGGGGGGGGRGGNRGRGGAPARAPLDISQRQIDEFISRIHRKSPSFSPEELGSQIFGNFGREAMRRALENPSTYQLQLEAIFSHRLFTDSQNTLAKSLTDRAIETATGMLFDFFRSDNPFSRDRLGRVAFDDDCDQLRRYLRIYDGFRSRFGVGEFKAMSVDHLKMLKKFADMCQARFGPNGAEAGIARNMAALAEETILEKERAEQDAARRQGTRRGGRGGGAAALNVAATADDVEYEQGYLTNEQKLDFEPSFDRSVVEPTFEELIRDMDSEAAKADDAKARRITLGAPIVSFRHHLDNVFFTTRYDALLPLREGIHYLLANDFKMPKKGEAPLAIKVYRDLQIVGVEGSRDNGPLFIFKSAALLESAKKNANIGKRRLLPGSLVVLTHDNLETGEVCQVIRVKNYDLEKGFICIRRSDQTQLTGAGGGQDAVLGPLKNMHVPYMLLESNVYWEPHSHSLRALQGIVPKANDLFNRLSCQEEEDGEDVPFLFAETFDKEAIALFTFDVSQSAAFNHIFASPAPIVQGPPGTGKSYIGVTAVRTMLKEGVHGGAPILIVCYTNHALDSFLSDLISKEPELFEDRSTLIRFGFRSKNEALEKYMLPSNSIGMAPYIDAERKLREVWSDAIAENFVPAPPSHLEDANLDIVCDYFEKLQNAKEVQRDAARRELARAESSYKRFNDSVSPSDVDAFKAGCRAVGVRSLANETFASALQKLSDGSANDGEAYNGYLVALDCHHEGTDEHLMALARGARMSSAQQRALDQFMASKEALKAAENAAENFLVLWRDAKGLRKKVGGPNIERVVNNGHEEEEQQDFDLQGDIGEENEDRFMEQPEEEIGGQPNQGGNNRGARALLTDIQAVQVARPAFLDHVSASVLDSLTTNGRYDLYHYLKDRQLRSHFPQLIDAMVAVNNGSRRFRAANNDFHADAIAKAKVVGATTSGLARYLPRLSAIGVKCVVLEEAAEIPEAHALAALLPSVEHFIQIGDHQQLRPKISCYANRKKNLDISLMERMLQTNNDCKTLNIQRRMRAEIANFIRPLYTRKLEAAGLTLDDHQCVAAYPQSPSHAYGLSDSRGFVLYVRHNFPETLNANSQSYENANEAAAAVQMAWYLSKQNPDATITLLVPYTGMLLKVQQEAKNAPFKSINSHPPSTLNAAGKTPPPPPRKVRMVSIDDFQGEESDVVILCLTRSSKPGFLRENNRICVALSRARHLQIVIGNMNCFAAASKCYWPSVLDRASKLPGGGIASDFLLHCPHHNKERRVPIGASILQGAVSQLGGCLSICGLKREDCGHMCELQCHGGIDCRAVDKCNQPCARTGSECEVEGRVCDHACPRKCFESCGPCETRIDTICGCGNPVTIPCHALDRGAIGGAPKKRYRECARTFKTKLPCGHEENVKCCLVGNQNISCTAECGQQRDDCAHKCTAKCCDCFNRTTKTLSHEACQKDCGITLACGHACTSPCSNICPPCDAKCTNVCDHHPNRCDGGGGGKGKSNQQNSSSSAAANDDTSASSHRCGQPSKCTPCKEKCTNACPHTKCTRLCCDPCDRERCEKQCTEKLQCGHRCRGICGEACLTRCVVCKPMEDDEVVFGGETEENALFIQLACGHMFEKEDMDGYIAKETDFTEKAIKTPACPKCRSLILPSHLGVRRYKKELITARREMHKVQKRVEELYEKAKGMVEEAMENISRLRELVKTARRTPAPLNNVLCNLIDSTLDMAERIAKQNEAIEADRKAEEEKEKQAAGGKKKKSQHVHRNKNINLEISIAVAHRINIVTIVGKALIAKEQELSRMASDMVLLNSLEQFIKLPGNEKDIVKKMDERMLSLLRTAIEVQSGGRKDYEETDGVPKLALILSKLRGVRLSDAEKASIVNALFESGQIQRQGAFRRCPCGYIYAIGDCGGAMVRARCPECRRPIGGESHRDAEGIAHDNTMDGSAGPAWPQ